MTVGETWTCFGLVAFNTIISEMLFYKHPSYKSAPSFMRSQTYWREAHSEPRWSALKRAQPRSSCWVGRVATKYKNSQSPEKADQYSQSPEKADQYSVSPWSTLFATCMTFWFRFTCEATKIYFHFLILVSIYLFISFSEKTHKVKANIKKKTSSFHCKEYHGKRFLFFTGSFTFGLLVDLGCHDISAATCSSHQGCRK